MRCSTFGASNETNSLETVGNDEAEQSETVSHGLRPYPWVYWRPRDSSD